MKVTTSQQRIKELMDYLNMNLSEFSKRTGVQKSALSNYLHGTREPRQDKISMMADAFGVNPAWLMGHDEPMFAPSYTTADDSKSRELYERYLRAIPEIQRAVDRLLEADQSDT